MEDHSSQYKVWNLSLSSNRMCSGIVSEFTAAIDELQKKHNVLFVIATGNASNEEERRVTLPGDSVRGSDCWCNSIREFIPCCS
ncbi:S8 family serine peptidase [Bacillus cereus]